MNGLYLYNKGNIINRIQLSRVVMECWKCLNRLVVLQGTDRSWLPNLSVELPLSS